MVDAILEWRRSRVSLWPAKKYSFKVSPFATIDRSGSISVKLNEFLGSDVGRSQLNDMKRVRTVAERMAAHASVNSGKK